ncbi:hypothetical protein HOW07_09980 [Plantibacter sp. MCCC 1A11337]|uniref:hypothetical protein n=1 Tax=Plantibacter sp. MCCC 1A11337 TaxID=2736644 RepID=UPI0015825EF2|nr:hypothetical protein [Plantibacter sp. MCCC 1A11337]NUJ88337.1 hypothetical protein [Plantibacter sp. MCCC 1A11337]
MQRAAEIAAQVFIARDALLRNRREDLRVAFLLLDSAVETLMVRWTQTHLAMGSWGGSHDGYWPDQEPVPIVLNDFNQRERMRAEAKDNYVRWQLSDTQKRSIGRDFSDKLRVLAWNGDIPTEYVPVLARLHDYRNEMYHREESRPNALRVLAHLYAWLTADLLERLRPGIFSRWGGDPDDIVERTYERMGRPVPVPMDGFKIQNDMATALREGLDLATAPQLLADYAAERIESVHDAIEFSAEYIGEVQRISDVTEMDIVRLLYHEGGPQLGLAEMRHFKAPVTRAMIARWDRWPELIRGTPGAVEAFRSLTDMEASFEDFETRVHELAREVDGAIQFEFDLARGK